MSPPRSIAVPAAVWIAVGLVQIFNWGEAGPWKSLVLLALLAGAFVILRALDGAQSSDAPPPRALVILVIALALAELVYGGLRLVHPRLIDMATTTLAAGNAMLAGSNPYVLPISPELGEVFQGYKYLPFMPVVYMPLGLALGDRGVPLTNMIMQTACALLMLHLGSKSSSRRAGFVAAALYLSLPLVSEQLFAKGTTDLAAIVPLLAGFAFFGRSDFASGLCAGLSVSAKLFPGMVFLPCLLPEDPAARLRYGAGVLAGLLPILPYALAAPAAFADNILLFNAVRPPDVTSWLAFAPPWAGIPARVAFVALYFAAAAYVWRKPPSLAARLGLGALLTIAVILVAPVEHHNYMLWWLPFYALALAAALQNRRAAL